MLEIHREYHTTAGLDSYGEYALITEIKHGLVYYKLYNGGVFMYTGKRIETDFKIKFPLKGYSRNLTNVL